MPDKADDDIEMDPDFVKAADQSAEPMTRRQLHGPSLKITRLPDRSGVRGFAFEVWSPFTGSYQAEPSVDAAMRRVDHIAGLICQMWLQRHPKHDTLADTPAPVAANANAWAEFRIRVATYRSYDTRRHDKPEWTRAANLTQATETTCIRVGCAPPRLSG